MKPDFSPIPFAKIHILFQYFVIFSKNHQNHSTFNRFSIKIGMILLKSLAVKS